MLKIVTIIGARPQFVKAGVVSREIKRRSQQGTPISEVIVHTGQHFDANMSEIFFQEMNIPTPNYHLGIGGKSHGAMTGQMLEKIEEILLKEQPACTLVYGDTNSTLAGALAASKLNIPVVHVEAGLRSFNLSMPEEINRILTDRISQLLICPTEVAMENLKKEGVGIWSQRPTCIRTGDVMLDAARYYARRAQPPAGIAIDKKFVLCTVHRAENTDQPERMRGILAALGQIAQEVQVIFPVHPRTYQALNKSDSPKSQLTLLEPVGYLNMVWLIQNCACVLTDSGGLQKEAFFFQKPCLTLRDETEWTELVSHSFNCLVGTDSDKIVRAWREFPFSDDWQQLWYGDGKASETVVESLLREFSK
jgi:UDP-GlcNAc3NAcA epimerase